MDLYVTVYIFLKKFTKMMPTMCLKRSSFNTIHNGSNVNLLTIVRTHLSFLEKFKKN